MWGGFFKAAQTPQVIELRKGSLDKGKNWYFRGYHASTWRYRVTARTGWPSVSLLRLGEGKTNNNNNNNNSSSSNNNKNKSNWWITGRSEQTRKRDVSFDQTLPTRHGSCDFSSKVVVGA